MYVTRYVLYHLLETLWLTSAILQARGDISQFRKHILSGKKYVDKTQFLVEVLSPWDFKSGTPSAFALFRPRSCGKSMNLNMIWDFVRFDNYKNETIFTPEMNIMQPQYTKLRETFMNKNPVIFMDFMNLVRPTFEETKNILHEMLQDLFGEYKYLMNSTGPNSVHIEYMKNLLASKQFESNDLNAIRILSRMISRHHRKEPFIIIDEIDGPIADAIMYGNSYYIQMRDLMTRFYSISFKENQSYEKIILAGVVPINTILPNTVSVYTIFDGSFDTFFGFTTNEVKRLIEDSRVQDKDDKLLSELKFWYNSLRIGNEDIFNPKSIMESFTRGWVVDNWASASGSLQKLTEYLVMNNGLLPSLNLQILLRNATLTKKIAYSVYFEHLLSAESVLWTYFTHVGVATADPFPSPRNNEGVPSVIQVPSEDMRTMLGKMMQALHTNGTAPDFDKLADFVEKNDTESAIKIIKTYIDKAGNYFSTENKPATPDEVVNYLQLVMKPWSISYGADVRITRLQNFTVMEFFDKGGKLKVRFFVKSGPEFWAELKRVTSSYETATEVTRVGSILILAEKIGKAVDPIHKDFHGG